MPDETSKLAQRAVQGDVTAFAALVERYQGMVHGLALAAVRQFADAEDIAQQTFVAAYQRLPTLRDPGRFAAWLRGIALNKIGTWLRKRRARQEVPMDLSSEQEERLPVAPAAEPPGASLKDRVLRAIEALPAEQRQAITLYYMDGRSYAEVAAFMGVPISTVKGRIQGGRNRLKKEMMAMVEETLEAEKPGREQAVRILRRAIGEAKKARGKRDYEQLLACCDRAMKALDRLPATARRRENRQEVLRWQGEAQERLLGRPTEAITCYQSALEIATEAGDAGGQDRAMRAILPTLGRAGDFGAMKSAAERGMEIAQAGNNQELLAFCTAARDLCTDRSRKVDAGATGGFALGHFRITEQGGRHVLEPPRRRDDGKVRANISVNLNCGTPLWPSLLYGVYGPKCILPTDAEVSQTWAEDLDTGWVTWRLDLTGAKLACTSRVESADDTVAVPAGRFPGCLRVRTDIAVAQGRQSSTANGRFVARKVTGTRWTWFAPGVGLVRLLHADNERDVSDVVLTAHGPKRQGTALLPLERGHWWRYRWLAFGGALMTETWRVAGSNGGQALISCAVHSHKASRLAARRLRLLTTTYLERCEDKKLQAIGLLRSAGSDAGKLRRAASLAGKAGEAGLQARALHSLAWQYEEDKEPEKALKTWQRELDVLRDAEDAGEYGWLAFDAAGAFYRFRRFDRMADLSRDCEALCRKIRQPDSVADWAGLVELARWLSEQGRDAEIGGYRHGQAELTVSQAAVRAGSRGSATCVSLRKTDEEKPGFGPACLGIGRIVVLPSRVGKTWTDNWNTGGGSGSVTPVVKSRIEARNDKVETPAGRFGRCVRVRSEIRTTFGAGAAAPDQRWQGYHDGVRLDWYAPGVGLVKVDYQHSNGDRTGVELAEYKVSRAGDSLLPDRVGNTWQYEWRDATGALMLREFWRIAAKKGKMAYLGFGAVEVK